MEGHESMPKISLPDCAYIAVGGKDAADFLQGLITTDLAGVEAGEAHAGALLTPQGKILFDFLISRSDDGFILETQISQRDALVKRFSMYKMRADVTLTSLDAVGTMVIWGEDVSASGLKDMRFAKAGVDLRRVAAGTTSEDATAYHRLRIENGIAEAGSDFALSDTFPHDIMLDMNGGVSFKKGCYVGQEVVSRMQHRSTARRRIVIVKADGALPVSGAELLADGKLAGVLGSAVGSQGLALARIDKLGDAIAEGKPLTIGDIGITVSLPTWTGLSFPTSNDEVPA